MRKKQSERILLVSEEFPPHVGGAGSVAYQNAVALSQWSKVDVLTRERSGGTEREEPFRSLEVWSQPKLWVISLGYVLSTMDLSTYSAIILNDVGAAFVAGAVLNRENLSKSVVYTHGSDLSQVLGSPSVMYRLCRVPSFYRRALNNCYRIISVSRQQAERLKQVNGISGLTRRTCVIYSGIDRTVFKRKPVNSNDPSKVQLLSVGRVEASKGFPRKYEIFRSLIEDGLNVNWTVVGAGSYLDELTQNVRRDGLGDHVRVVGAVARSELPAFYSEADIFWLLSDQESFGLVYLEANACGCPVIARRGSGADEAVQDGITGFLVSDGEECMEVIGKRKYEDLDPSDLIQHADQFALRRMAGKLLSLLRSIDNAPSNSCSS